MIAHDVDSLAQQLRLLRSLPPDPFRAACVRARCRAELERTRRPDRSGVILEVVGYFLAPVLVGCLCGFYIAGLFATALRFRGLFE